MSICVEELRRCQKVSPRSNFVVLLGDRYGWQPLPFSILAEKFETLLMAITGEEQPQLFIQLELLECSSSVPS